jgi:hypothetical protein
MTTADGTIHGESPQVSDGARRSLIKSLGKATNTKTSNGHSMVSRIALIGRRGIEKTKYYRSITACVWVADNCANNGLV